MQVKKFSKHQNYSKQKLRTMLIIFCFVFISVPMKILTEYFFIIAVKRESINYLMVFSYIMTTTPIFLSIFQLTFGMHLLKTRFDILIEILLENFAPEKFAWDKEKESKAIDKRLVINDLITLHDQLSDGILIINSTCTFQMIPVLTICMSEGIFSLHRVVKQYFVETQHFWTLLFNNLFFFTSYWITISFMLRVSSKITNAIKRISVIVSKVLINSEEESIIRKLELFTQQIQQREKVVRNDFFIIDWSLMFTMLTSLITMLIITCQFQSTFTK